ncbi:hypothetical protein KFE25_005414 [Diacronema lutheri]|uniref:Uncharacterized protein n=1 Tax=Diacronema lutheri TaxID=2081491 RepID=A0A8J5XSP6_DIALT|nr:hypothetical protein KFE25_005414 [Diacronema lutheri]
MSSAPELPSLPHARGGNGGGGDDDDGSRGRPALAQHSGGGGSRQKLRREIRPAEWERPQQPPPSNAWSKRALAAEATLAAREHLRSELRRAAELGIIAFTAPPMLVSPEHPMFAIPASRARLQYNESPGGTPRIALSAPISVETAAHLVANSALPRRKQPHLVTSPNRVLRAKSRPTSDPLDLPAVPAERRQRLPRLTLNRTLPRVAAAAAEPAVEPRARALVIYNQLII